MSWANSRLFADIISKVLKRVKDPESWEAAWGIIEDSTKDFVTTRAYVQTERKRWTPLA